MGDDAYDDLLRQADAARELGVTRGRVAQLIRKGRIETIRVGGYQLIRRTDLERFKATPRSVGGRPRKQAVRADDSYDGSPDGAT